jgi:hypothetical protein
VYIHDIKHKKLLCSKTNVNTYEHVSTCILNINTKLAKSNITLTSVMIFHNSFNNSFLNTQFQNIESFPNKEALSYNLTNHIKSNK